MALDYPSGSWGAELQRLEQIIDSLPWYLFPLKRHYRQRIAAARRAVLVGEVRAIKKYFGDTWP